MTAKETKDRDMLQRKMIIDSAKIESRPGIHYLGPFARRVSFTSQQIRALNLVWALYEDQQIRSNDRVAVVGAGIAGVTAACALRAYGCTVDVFDREAEPMSRQREAKHRTVHPNINSWPAATGLLPTTSLPFMEWYCQPCNDIIDVLMGQWDDFVAKDPELLQFSGKHEVRNAWEDHGQIFLDVQPIVRTAYKTAIVAAGFGNEVTQPRFTTIDYWKRDDLESCRSDRQITNFVISGCGDGGMIDALRAAYDFERGHLAIEVAATLAGTDIATLLLEYDKARQPLTNEYMNLARMIDDDPRYADTKRLLTSKLDDRVGLVILTDSRFENPFNSGAAPIHKLMVAFARSRGIIRYRQGTVARGDGDFITSPFSTHDAKETRVVVRHGAHLGFGRLLTQDEVDAYRKRQEILSEYNSEPVYQNYPALAPWPPYDPASPVFRSHRRPLAEEAIREFGNVSRVKATLEGFEVLYTGDLKLKPEKLFSVPATFKPEHEVPTEEALV